MKKTNFLLYLHLQRPLLGTIRGDARSIPQGGNARNLGGRRGPWVVGASSAVRPSCSPWWPQDCKRRWDPRGETLRDRKLSG